MINQYLKDNKSDEELAFEFLSLLKRGESITQIAKQYELAPSRIQDILIKSGYTFNSTSSLWEKSKPVANHKQQDDQYLTTTLQTGTAQNDKNNVPSSDNKSNNPSSYGKTNSILPIPISLANMLNNGTSLESLKKKYNVTTSDIESTLLTNGFQYYSFLNHWTKKNPTNFSEELVEQLNHDKNILFKRFNIRPQEQDKCLQEIKNFLQSNGYSYSFSNNAWELTAIDQQLYLLVDELNKTESLKEVAKKFNMADITLRQILKNNGYHYYGLLNIWTNKSDKNLLEELVQELSNETLTLAQLAERNIDIEKLKQALLKEGIQYEKKATQTTEIQKSAEDYENDEKPRTLENAQNHEDHVVQETQQSLLQSQFDKEEINSLKEMIQDWKKRKVEEQSINCDPVEISIYLPANLLALITSLSEKDGISRSLIINNALKEYLNQK